MYTFKCNFFFCFSYAQSELTDESKQKEHLNEIKSDLLSELGLTEKIHPPYPKLKINIRYTLFPYLQFLFKKASI
jgi:hypothetical protein